MITPVDIQNHEFTKQAFGYGKHQVDEFLLEVSAEFEKTYRENLELKDRVTMLNDSLRQYKAMEEALQNTLMFAQNTAEEVKKNAQEKADLIVKDAEQKAKDIVTSAETKVFESERKLEELKNEYAVFKSKFEALLEGQKKLLEEIVG